MPDNKLDRLTRLRSACTGESHAQAREHLILLGPWHAPIPSAVLARQAQLEWWFLFLSAWPNSIAAHPLGFTRVIPSADGLTVQVERSSDRLEDLTRCLLPSVFEDEIGGIPGLRLSQTASGAPVLKLAGTTAHIVLLGMGAREWHEAVDARRRHLREIGAKVLWECPSPAMTRAELEQLDWFDSKLEGAPYRFTSALLRRIGAFRAGGLPVRVTGWITGGVVRNSWKFEVEYVPGAGADYRKVVELLIDPEVGLSNVSLTHDCLGNRGGWVTLVAGGDLLGRVQLLLHDCDEVTVSAWEQTWPAVVSVIKANAGPRRRPSPVAAVGRSEASRSPGCSDR